MINSHTIYTFTIRGTCTKLFKVWHFFKGQISKSGEGANFAPEGTKLPWKLGLETGFFWEGKVSKDTSTEVFKLYVYTDNQAAGEILLERGKTSFTQMKLFSI